jgi:hypothetical protein
VESSCAVNALFSLSISRAKSLSASIGDSLSYWSAPEKLRLGGGGDFSALGDFLGIETFAVESGEVREEDCVV